MNFPFKLSYNTLVMIIIVMIITFLLFLFIVDDSKKQLSGVWISSDEFNQSSGLSTLLLTINTKLNKGQLVISPNNSDNLVLNSDFDISFGVKRFIKTFKYNFENISAKLTFKSESIWPNNVLLTMDNGILYVYNTDGGLLAQCMRKIIN